MQSYLVEAECAFFGRDGRPHVLKHVLSFGDSHVEREAVRAVCKNVPATRTKSIKFADRPTIEQLRRQLELVIQCFAYLTSHDGDLDLQLTVTTNLPINPPIHAAPPPIVVDHPNPVGEVSPAVLDSSDAAMLGEDAKSSSSSEMVDDSANDEDIIAAAKEKKILHTECNNTNNNIIQA